MGPLQHPVVVRIIAPSAADNSSFFIGNTPRWGSNVISDEQPYLSIKGTQVAGWHFLNIFESRVAKSERYSDANDHVGLSG